MDDAKPRPLSVKELRVKFEGKGKAQTPVEFDEVKAAAARSRQLATLQNVNIRVRQIREARRASAAGPRVTAAAEGSDTAEDDFTALATRRRSFRAPPSVNSEVGHDAIDAMGVAALRALCEERGKDTAHVLELGELRALAHALLTLPPPAFEVMTDDDYVNSLSAKELKGFIEDHGGSAEGIFEVGTLRQRARELKHQPDFEQRADLFSDAHFFFPELAAALASGSDEVINKAVLMALFQEHAPERLGEVDSLLTQYAGREEQLLDELLGEFAPHMESAGPASTVVFIMPAEERSTNGGDGARRPSMIVGGSRRPSGIWRVNELDRLEQELRMQEDLERERRAAEANDPSSP